MMRVPILFWLTLTLSSSIARAQTELKVDPAHACGAAPFALPVGVYVFEPTSVAKEMLANIVAYVGLSAENLHLRASNVDNAIAYFDPISSARLILYNQEFLKTLEGTTKSAWASKAIFAHELGHHLNQHMQVVTPDRRRVEELEADRFAGHVLFKMGASLEALTTVFKELAEGDGYPPRSARIAAATSGWWAAKEQGGYREPDAPALTSEQRREVREGRVPEQSEAPAVVKVDTPAGPLVTDFKLTVDAMPSVRHAGGLSPGPGFAIKMKGMVTLPSASAARVLIRFAFPNGQQLVPYATEFRYRATNGLLATGTGPVSLPAGKTDLSTLSIDPIPYYALNLIASGYRTTYPIMVYADVYVGEQLVYQAPPTEVFVQW